MAWYQNLILIDKIEKSCTCYNKTEGRGIRRYAVVFKGLEYQDALPGIKFPGVVGRRICSRNEDGEPFELGLVNVQRNEQLLERIALTSLTIEDLCERSILRKLHLPYSTNGRDGVLMNDVRRRGNFNMLHFYFELVLRT